MADDSQGFFKAYEEYSKVLRTWLVAYGIGAPTLFLTNESVSKAILASPDAKSIAGLFLGGVAAQVILAAINKHSMWVLYYGETERTFRTSRWYRIADWMSDRIWIDLAVDVVTFLLFSRATWLAYTVLLLTR